MALLLKACTTLFCAELGVMDLMMEAPFKGHIFVTASKLFVRRIQVGRDPLKVMTAAWCLTVCSSVVTTLFNVNTDLVISTYVRTTGAQLNISNFKDLAVGPWDTSEGFIVHLLPSGHNHIWVLFC